MKLEIGSGYHPNMEYDIHLDINPACPHVEIVSSADKISYPDNSFDAIRASDVLEHFSYRDTIRVLKEWCRVLKPGGSIYIQCPNAKALAKRWIEDDLPILSWEGKEMPIDFSASYWICGGQEDGNFAKKNDDWRWNSHYALFSPESLTYYLQLAGLTVWSIGSDGGSNIICTAVK